MLTITNTHGHCYGQSEDVVQTPSRKQPGKCRESLFKVSLTTLLTNGVRREYETAAVENEKM